MKRKVPRLQGAARKLGKGELIGREATVARAADQGIIGLTGEIVDETLHTLTLRVGGPGGRRVQLAKVGAMFRFGDVEVDGAALEFRPVDRTKKVR